MRHLNNDGRLALAVNGQYIHALITRDDIVAEASSWGLRNPGPAVNESLETLRDFADEHAPAPAADPRVHRDIQRFTRNLLSGQAAGEE